MLPTVPRPMPDNKKKRSSRACEICRARKVRCDMQLFGAPCTNCRHQETSCIPAEDTRSNAHAAHLATHTKSRGRKFLKNHCRRCNAELMKGSEHHRESEESPTVSSWRPSDGHQSHDLLDRDDQTSCSPLPTNHNNPSSTSVDNDPCWTFLARPRLLDDDMALLQRRGAFKAPEQALMLELLTSYCNWIHPQLPVVDLRPFLNAVVGRNGHKVSSLLFQAVMFAGAAHLDDEVLRLHGCTSRDETQDRLFNRAKLLYQFDVESDPLTIAQATLLMSINHQCSKTSTIWLAQSHLLAQNLGLENPAAYALMKAERSDSGKRLWWSIFARDSTLRLELGAPQRLQDAPYGVPPLGLDCFNLLPFSAEVQERLPRAAILRSPAIHRLLMQIAIRRADLACYLNQVLVISSRLPLFTKAHQGISINIEERLQSWGSELEPELHFHSSSSAVVDYHCGLLSLLYLSTSNTLLRSRLQPVNSAVVDLGVRSNVERDTAKTLNIAGALYSSGGCLPPTLGMGMVYNAVNLYVELAVWRKVKGADPLYLDSAIVCLCALIKSQPRRTAVGIALCHLGSRIRGLESAECEVESEYPRRLEKTESKETVRQQDILKRCYLGRQSQHSPEVGLDVAEDQTEDDPISRSFDELFEWPMESEDNEQHLLRDTDGVVCV